MINYTKIKTKNGGTMIVEKNKYQPQKLGVWDFPGSPVVKTLHFNAGGMDSISG